MCRALQGPCLGALGTERRTEQLDEEEDLRHRGEAICNLAAFGPNRSSFTFSAGGPTPLNAPSLHAQRSSLCSSMSLFAAIFHRGGQKKELFRGPAGEGDDEAEQDEALVSLADLQEVLSANRSG